VTYLPYGVCFLFLIGF